MQCLYIAGPMSHIPQYNFPLFEAVAVALREDGWTIVSPHECDSEETRRAAWASPDSESDGTGAESWGTCLARDVKMLADGHNLMMPDEDHPGNNRTVTTHIDGIAFLPNWNNSRGARLEAFVGLLTKKEFYIVSPEGYGDTAGVTLESVTTEWVQHMLAAPWAEAIKMHTPLQYVETIP